MLPPDDEASIERKRQRTLFTAFSLIYGVGLAPFIVITYFEGHPLWSLADACLLLVVAANLLLARLHRRYDLANVAIVVFWGCSFTWFATTQLYSTVWSFCFPAATFYFLGKRRGLVVNVAFIATAVSILALDNAHYPRAFLMRYAGALVLLTGGSYLYEKIQLDTFRKLRAKTRALHESEAFLQQIISSAREGIIVLDREFVCVLWNDFMEEMTGIRADEVLGRKPGDIFPFLGGNELDRLRQRALYGDTVRSSEVSYSVAQSGRSGWAVMVHGPHRNSRGEIVGVVVIVREITVQKELEDRLSQAQKLETVGQLAGGVAHDFNNQLTVIAGCAELLRDEVPDRSHASGYVDTILISASRSADLTKKLLTFARKGAQEMALVDVKRVVEEVVGFLKRSIDKRIVFEMHLDAANPVVRGDLSQLQNATLNLALNARDAMPDGGTLTFRTAVESISASDPRLRSFRLAAGSFVVLTVADTGEGMTDDVKKHLFEPFFTTKAQGKGTGMGLAAVHGTMLAHQGAVTVKSAIGRGTMVELCIPHAGEAHSATSESGPPSPRPRAAAKPWRLLLVEDEEALRNTAHSTLTRLGYRVNACANGREGVDLYRIQWRETDLVILDMIMPEMNGIEALRAMRAIHPGIRAIFVSGHSLASDPIALRHEGILELVHKPFQWAELADAITRALEAPESGNSSTRKPGSKE